MTLKFRFTLIAGPTFLLATLILLFAKTARLLGHPVWIVGMSLSTLLSAYITYLAIKELLSMETSIEDENHIQEKKLNDLQATLDETHIIYREKVEKLEEEIVTLEEAQTEKEDEIEEMKVGFEKLYDELSNAKSSANSFQVSLEDALDELREARKQTYLEHQTGKQIPTDLVQQHQQLRGQFEEKSLILDQTRRRLFTLEGELIALKKEKELNDDEELTCLIESLQQSGEERQALEQETALLESLVASSPKKAPSKATKKTVDQMLELQF